MKVVFAGTPEFAAVALDALLAAGFAVPLVSPFIVSGFVLATIHRA